MCWASGLATANASAKVLAGFAIENAAVIENEEADILRGMNAGIRFFLNLLPERRHRDGAEFGAWVPTVGIGRHSVSADCRPEEPFTGGRRLECGLESLQVFLEIVHRREVFVTLQDDRLDRGVGQGVFEQAPKVLLNCLAMGVRPTIIVVRISSHMQLHDALGIDVAQPGMRIEAVIAGIDEKAGDVEEEPAVRGFAKTVEELRFRHPPGDTQIGGDVFEDYRLGAAFTDGVDTLGQ